MPQPSTLVRKVMAMDAFRLTSTLPKESIGAVITEPPPVVADEHNNPIDQGSWDWYGKLADETFRILRPGGASVFIGNGRSTSVWDIAASKAGLRWMGELTVLWDTDKPRNRLFGSLTSSVRWHIKPGGRHNFNPTIRRAVESNVIICKRIPSTERIHPHQKPVELTNFFVSLLTAETDIVFDPFCGSGSTLVSSAICGRQWIGNDVDNVFAERAYRRAIKAEVGDLPDMNDLYLWVNMKIVKVEG